MMSFGTSAEFEEAKMDRRQFVVGSAAAGALASAQPVSAVGATNKPNILYIMVDELRFPSAFPTGVQSVGEFLRRFMPNTHSLWRRGVKFGNHFTAGVACTPARGTLISGLYTQ